MRDPDSEITVSGVIVMILVLAFTSWVVFSAYAKRDEMRSQVPAAIPLYPHYP